MTDGPLEFTVERNANPASDEVRASILANPGFGKFHTDHMVSIDYVAGKGWHDARVIPYGPIELDPSAIVLHYAQEVFEGLKAYRWADGAIVSFRPESNARRLRTSARRLAIPELPEETFIDSLRQLIAVDQQWVADRRGADVGVDVGQARPVFEGDVGFGQPGQVVARSAAFAAVQDRQLVRGHEPDGVVLDAGQRGERGRALVVDDAKAGRPHGGEPGAARVRHDDRAFEAEPGAQPGDLRRVRVRAVGQHGRPVTPAVRRGGQGVSDAVDVHERVARPGARVGLGRVLVVGEEGQKVTTLRRTSPWCMRSKACSTPSTPIRSVTNLSSGSRPCR